MESFCFSCQQIIKIFIPLCRLRASGQSYLAYHPGLKRDALAYHGCAEIFQVPNFFFIYVLSQPDWGYILLKMSNQYISAGKWNNFGIFW